MLIASLKIAFTTLNTFGYGKKLVCKNKLIRSWSYRFLCRRRCRGSAVKSLVGTGRQGVEFFHLLMSKNRLFLEKVLIDHIGDGSEVGLLSVGKNRSGNRE